MFNITLKSIPNKLYFKLKKRAVMYHRSLNREVIACLEEALLDKKADIPALLAKIRSVRGQITGKVSDSLLSQMKSEGRR